MSEGEQTSLRDAHELGPACVFATGIVPRDDTIADASLPCTRSARCVFSLHVVLTELRQAPTPQLDRNVTFSAERETVAALLGSLDEVALYLVAIDGPEAGRSIELGAQTMSIGRDPHLDIVNTGNKVSRLHALATVIDLAVVVEDLESLNGTFIDGERVFKRATLHAGSVLQIGDHSLKCERCSRRDMEQAMSLRRDLDRAARYVHSLLPAPVAEGPIRTEWLFFPCARLGGDAFGFEQLDQQTSLIYLIDVSGHGVGAAMHSVSILNALRHAKLVLYSVPPLIGEVFDNASLSEIIPIATDEAAAHAAVSS